MKEPDAMKRHRSYPMYVLAPLFFLGIFWAVPEATPTPEKGGPLDLYRILNVTIPGDDGFPLAATLYASREKASAALLLHPCGGKRWLEGYAYRIEISGWTFVLAGLVALSVAVGTVGYQAVKAALSDPVKSLRYE